MSKVKRMEELYKSYKNKNTPIAKTLKKLIRDMKRNKPTKSAAKKGGGDGNSPITEVKEVAGERKNLALKIKGIEKGFENLAHSKEKANIAFQALMNRGNDSPTVTTNTETETPTSGSPVSTLSPTSSGPVSPKTEEEQSKRSKKPKKSKKSNQKTGRKQPTKGNAGRQTKSVKAYVKRSRELIGKGGRKTKKKRKHKRKTKKK